MRDGSPEVADGTAEQRVARGRPMHAGPSEAGRRWAAANREAIEAWNRWYEENGSPLDELATP